MFIKLEQIRALLIRSIHEIRVNPRKFFRLRAYKSQYTTMEVAVDLCRLTVCISG